MKIVKFLINVIFAGIATVVGHYLNLYPENQFYLVYLVWYLVISAYDHGNN